jgi:hypothetical protein
VRKISGPSSAVCALTADIDQWMAQRCMKHDQMSMPLD